MVRSVVFILEYVFFLAVAVVIVDKKNKKNKIPVNCLRRRHRHKYNETVLFVGNACTHRDRQREKYVVEMHFGVIVFEIVLFFGRFQSILLLLKRDKQANSHAHIHCERREMEYRIHNHIFLYECVVFGVAIVLSFFLILCVCAFFLSCRCLPEKICAPVNERRTSRK